jgi:PadR family transcriptional regulator, regulatory protein AphA
LAGPLGEDLFRSPFLLFARFAHILPRDLVEARVNEYLEKHIADHRRLEEAFAERGSNASDTWVINYGRAVMEVAERHIRSHMHELITLARAEPKKDAAE